MTEPTRVQADPTFTSAPNSPRFLPPLTDPLSEAVTARDRNVIEMVAQAVQQRQTLLALQPIVRTDRDRTTVYHEGLIRVLDETGRIIPARHFISTIEEMELGRRIDCLALEHGLQALADDTSLRLSVNMSARSIGYGPWRDLLARGLGSDTSVTDRLILEISEASAMIMPEIVISFMSDTQPMGLSFALDDFGAGFTAFRHLRRFYFDILKIDQHFVTDVSRNIDNQVVMQALTTIGENMEMITVACGVENEADATYLQGLGVDCLQGFHTGPPQTLATPTVRHGTARQQ